MLAVKNTCQKAKQKTKEVYNQAKQNVKEAKTASKEAVLAYKSLNTMELQTPSKDMSFKEKAILTGQNLLLSKAQKEKGKLDGTVDVLKNTYGELKELVTNPGGVLNNLVTAVSHPIETTKSIGNAIKDSYEKDVLNGNAYTRSKWMTNVKLTTATAIVGTKGVGSVTKVGKLKGDIPSSKPTKDPKKPAETKGAGKGGSSGSHRDFREAKDQDKKLIDDVFKKYNAGKRKNVAVTKGEVNGEKIDLESVSGKIDPANPNHKDNFSKPSENHYKYSGSDKNGRLNDTEQKMIEHLREKYKDTPNVNGNIEIISHKAICQSCNDIIDQFQKDFPNINITRVQILDE